MPRIAFPRPRAHDGKTGVPEEVNHIIFLHPGYESGAQSLLLLPACDDDDTIDYEVARIACAIVACNRYDGYFTTDQAGLQRVPEPRLDCTNEGYFFQVPNRNPEDPPYPVYPSFRLWSFLSSQSLPSLWGECTIPASLGEVGRPTGTPNDDIIARDKTCRMTANMLGTEAAHIIPEAETVWFHSNNFLVDGGLGSTRNKLLLRADVHRVWDAQTFTFVPRRVGEGEEQTTEWVTYVLKRRTRPEVRLLYHDVRLQPLSEVSVLFLFCRFAWTIFDSLEIFLDRLVDRWLMMVDPLTGKMKSTQCSAKDCQDRKFTMRGRSASPVKRKAPESSTEGKRRAAVAEEGDEPATDLMVSESEKIACGAFGDQGSSDEEIGRGRKRRPRSVDLATRLWSDIAGTGRSTW